MGPAPLDGAGGRDPAAELAALEAAGLRRMLRVLDSPQGPRVRVGGRGLWNFSSNDYLGLAAHPALAEAAATAARDHGFGAGASRLVCGTLRPHAELEDALAEFKGAGAALAFGSGWAAGHGTLTALAGKGDFILLDKLAHACLVDGARASGATLRVFAHNDLDQLAAQLRWARRRAPARARVIVVTEAVFSMDGDLAPLAEIVALKDAHGAWLMLDEAHSTGVLGPGGRGLAAAHGLAGVVELQLGTLSKAIGAHGGFVASGRDLADLLVNRARPFIYATAPPPPVVAAALAGLRLAGGPEGDRRRALLAGAAAGIAAALGLPPPATPIIPFPVGAERDAVAWSAALLELGILAPAIRYPTVPRGRARIRFSASAAHGAEALAALAAALAASRPAAGFGA
jgi:8-amino-7-oxononanoate synthase